MVGISTSYVYWLEFKNIYIYILKNMVYLLSTDSIELDVYASSCASDCQFVLMEFGLECVHGGESGIMFLLLCENVFSCIHRMQ